MRVSTKRLTKIIGVAPKKKSSQRNAGIHPVVAYYKKGDKLLHVDLCLTNLVTMRYFFLHL